MFRGVSWFRLHFRTRFRVGLAAFGSNFLRQRCHPNIFCDDVFFMGVLPESFAAATAAILATHSRLHVVALA